MNFREWFRFNLLKSKHNLLDNFYPSREEILAVTNFEVVNEIRNFEDKNKVKVVSASPDLFVKYIVRVLPLDIEAFGSLDVNLKGKEKLKFIKRMGWLPFTYIGDSSADDVIGGDENCVKFIKV